ncbi:MAG: tRNA (adenosine(37)-N6)-dimethylallyltransferase MiaA [Syntrophales bacterium]|nr:tRNA (adenosine(37)-N6)-dimethylallyltransferase MiaA [Syntrophales bacterium]
MSSEEPKPRLIIIVGPTGVGKTEAAIRLAGELGGEIISADSMQVYRYMDIGTAKPTLEDRSQVRHHLIDVVNPDEEFNAAMFVREAGKIIGELNRLQKPIFIVGGTGLYIRALLGGLFEGPTADEDLREVYRQEAACHGKRYLYEKLKVKDERAAALIDANDISRIIRALEVLELTGKSIVEQQKAHHFRDNLYEPLKIGLMTERDQLYARIEQRTEKMMENGFADEVHNLLNMGYEETVKPMQSLGYKQIGGYLRGEYPLGEAVRRIKRDTRRYAKRQLTWFKADKDVEWFSPYETDAVRKRIGAFL